MNQINLLFNEISYSLLDVDCGVVNDVNQAIMTSQFYNDITVDSSTISGSQRLPLGGHLPILK